MIDPVIIIPVAGGAVAFLLGYLSMRMARKRRHILETPTSKAAGVFIGDVELKGTAESAGPLVSYLAESRCVQYSWSVAEHWRRTRVESYTDSKGNRRTRTVVETGWDTVASGGERIPFYLLDDSGYILIRPEGMQVEGIEVFGSECSRGHPLYYGKGPGGSVSGSTGRRRFTENAVPVRASIFVMGAARERSDIVAAEIAHSPQARFSMVTMETEESVAGGYTAKAWVAGVFGAVFAIAGLLIYSATLGMRDMQLVLWGVVAFAGYLALLSFLWSVMTYNALRTLRERVRRGWSNIDVELKRRADLIPNLAETVKGVRGHEAETQRVLALMRAQIVIPPSAARDGVATIQGIAPAVVALAESYPQLKASENFLALQRELSRTESRIALARTYYNGMVTSFNGRIAVVPNSLLAAVGGLRPFAFFEAKGLEREAVKVDFAR
ncbi:MAG: LemA family protein [Planctomycetota bacterium]|nr:LemA family protein [Planctomycetota bacterium]